MASSSVLRFRNLLLFVFLLSILTLITNVFYTSKTESAIMNQELLPPSYVGVWMTATAKLIHDFELGNNGEHSDVFLARAIALLKPDPPLPPSNLSGNYDTMPSILLRLEKDRQRKHLLNLLHCNSPHSFLRCRYNATALDSIAVPRTGEPIIPNLPLDPPATLDVTGYRVSGGGVGAEVNDGEIINGHRLLSQLKAQVKARRIVPLSVLEEHVFTIQSYDVNGDPVDHNDATFQARLIGTAIVTVQVKSIGGGRYRAVYTVVDPGEYILQVLAVTIEGEGKEPNLVNTKIPLLMNQIIYQSRHLINTVATSVPPSRTVLCLNGDNENGRWIHLPSGRCQQPYCTATESLNDLSINDPFGLNLNYVWAPIDCHYHLYSPLELAKCSADCGYNAISFHGDSLGREMLQNFQMMFTDFDPNFAMPKLKGQDWSTNTIEFRGDPAMTVTMTFGEDASAADVAVRQFSLVHLVSSTETMDDCIAAITPHIEQFAQWCATVPKKRCFLFLNPTVHREADYVTYRLSGSFYTSVTPRRVAAITEAARATAAKFKGALEIIAGQGPTKAHWFASWDGIHYSPSYNSYSLGDPRWFGGASTMLSQTLINALCNRKCNSQFEAIRAL